MNPAGPTHPKLTAQAPGPKLAAQAPPPAATESAVERTAAFTGERPGCPRSIVEFAFARLARVVRRRARPAGHAAIVPEDFSVTEDARDAVDRALDLLAVCSVARA